MRHLLSVKMLLIGLTLVFVLAACAKNPIPEINQVIPLDEAQQVESEPAAETPIQPDQDVSAAQEQKNQALTDEPVSESNVVEDSPTQENQSTGSGYPPPPDPVGDDPAPETGYPAPAEILPTPTLMPAYPAPSEDEDGSTGNDPEVQPPVKTGLEATDPSTVTLASGGLQFVEFFAFW